FSRSCKSIKAVFLLGGCQARGGHHYAKTFFRARAHNGETVAQKRYGNRQTTSAGSTRIDPPKNANRLKSASTMGRGTSQKRNRCAEHTIKREMAGRAWLCPRPENSRRHERLDHHNRAGRVCPRIVPLHN